MEVIATLESSSIARLRKTWAVCLLLLISFLLFFLLTIQGLTTEQMESFENLKKIVSQEKNFMKYREKLHKIEPPCVPYLGISIIMVLIIKINFNTIF